MSGDSFCRAGSSRKVLYNDWDGGLCGEVRQYSWGLVFSWNGFPLVTGICSRHFVQCSEGAAVPQPFPDVKAEANQKKRLAMVVRRAGYNRESKGVCTVPRHRFDWERDSRKALIRDRPFSSQFISECWNSFK